MASAMGKNRLSDQPQTLVISEPHAAIADLFPQHTIFLDQIFDQLLLTLIDPTANRDNKK